MPSLRGLIVGGDFFLGGTLVATLTKLVLRLRQFSEISAVVRNSVAAEALLIMTSILRLGQSKTSSPIDPDSYERIVLCINTLVAGDAYLPAYVLRLDPLPLAQMRAPNSNRTNEPTNCACSSFGS
jgi:hypothetical protein